MSSNRHFSVMDLKEYEYDAHLFGFTLNDFMTEIRQLVKEEVTKFTQLMTDALMKKYSSDNPEIEHVKELTKSLIDLYMCASVKPLKNLENQLKDILHVPPHVLLPDDAVQRTQYTAEDEQEVDEQLKQLLARIKRTKAFDIELRQELKMLRETLPVLNNQVKELQLLLAEQEERDRVLESLEPSIDEIVNNRLQSLNISKDL